MILLLKEGDKYDAIKKPTVSVCENEEPNHLHSNGHFCVNSAKEVNESLPKKKLKKRSNATKID